MNLRTVLRAGCCLVLLMFSAAGAIASAGTSAAGPSLERSADGRCSARSPAHTVALIELYTSEGCSSCPPADRWLSLIGKLAPERVAPLALHVVYWDQLGWKDPYAQARFTARQEWLTRRGGGRSIYTPGVFLDGREWRDWRRPGAESRSIGAVNRRRPEARIRIEQRRHETGSLVTVSARADTAPERRTALFVAVSESGLESDVRAGENRGSMLRHDHVVRQWSGPHQPASGQTANTGEAPLDDRVRWYRARLELPAGDGGDRRVTAFVQDLDSGAVLQALAVPVCNP